MTTNVIEQPIITSFPNERWQAVGNEFVMQSEASVWSKEGIQALRYLHSLGLKDETLRKYRVGYNPKDEFGSLENWGLTTEFNRNGNPKRVWLPRGIVVPCYIENMLRSIKIRRYLTQEQKSNGERSDYSIKGSMPMLFGVENLRNARLAVLTDNEFDAMLLDQVASDLVGAASFGSTARKIGAAEWASWGCYLLPIARILVPYTHEEEKIIITDSLPVYSRRTARAYLPNIPSVKTVTDLRKAREDPREWLSQTLRHLGLLERATTDIPGIAPVIATNESDPSKEANSSEEYSRVMIEDRNDDTNAAQKWVTYTLDQPWIVDRRRIPVTSCYCCNNEEYWRQSDGGWVCSTCHPNPNSH